MSRQHRGWELLRVSGEPSEEAFLADARGFVAALGKRGQATLVALRDGASLRSWVVTQQSDSDEDAVAFLSRAVTARLGDSDPVGVLSAGAAGRVVAAPVTVRRSSQFGVGARQVAEAMRLAVHDGEWVMVSVRQPSAGEQRRFAGWVRERLTEAEGVAGVTHYSSETNSAVVSVVGGAAGRRRVGTLLSQFMSALPGFDLDVKVRVPSRWRVAAVWALTAGLFGGAGVWLSDWLWPLVGAAAVFALVAAGVVAGWVPSAEVRLRGQVAAGWLRPPSRGGLLRRLGLTGGGRYPLARSSFLVGAGMVVPMVAPHAGAASGAASVSGDSASAVLLDADTGFGLGWASDGSLVRLPAATMRYGVGLIGAPGSGKTQVVRSLFGWHCVERVSPSGRAGWPGSESSLVAFEHKTAADARRYVGWAEAAGDECTLIEVGDPSSLRVDLFASTPGGASEKATAFVDAMVYAFLDGDIRGRSDESLTAAFTAALAVDDGLAADVTGGRCSPVRLAHVLLGGEGDELAVRLATGLMESAGEAEPGSDAAVAATELLPYFGQKVTAAQRRSLTEAARNKVKQLLKVSSWWGPDRTAVTWDQVLVQHRSVVVNAGATAEGAVVSERGGQLVSSMLTYFLREAIVRRCGGWLEEGRSVSLFADELSQLAGSSAEVVAWLRDQGRQFGVRAVLATQHPEQLDDHLRTSFLGFGSLLWFRQDNPGVAEVAARSLSLGGDEWSASQVANLAEHEAVLSTSVAGRRQPPVPLRLAFWEEDRGGSVAEFGAGRPVGMTTRRVGG